MTTQLPDPYIVEPDGSASADGVQRNFEALALALIDTGGQQLKLRCGVAQVNFPGGQTWSQTLTANHNLGATPLVVVGTVDLGAAMWGHAQIGTFTSTQFNVAVKTTDGTSPAGGTKANVWWIAVG